MLQMSVKKNDLKVAQGDDYSLAIECKNGTTAIDITNYNFFGKIKSKADLTTVIAEFTVNKGNPALGIALLQLSSTVTAGMPIPTQSDHVKKSAFYVYDILMQKPDGTKKRICEGTFELTPGVTL